MGDADDAVRNAVGQGGDGNAVQANRIQQRDNGFRAGFGEALRTAALVREVHQQAIVLPVGVAVAADVELLARPAGDLLALFGVNDGAEVSK